MSYTFTHRSLTIDDQSFPVDYFLGDNDSIIARCSMAKDSRSIDVRIEFPKDDLRYGGAHGAWLEQKAIRDAAQKEIDEINARQRRDAVQDAPPVIEPDSEAVKTQRLIDEYAWNISDLEGKLAKCKSKRSKTAQDIKANLRWYTGKLAEIATPTPPVTEAAEPVENDVTPSVDAYQPLEDAAAPHTITRLYDGDGWRIVHDYTLDKIRVILDDTAAQFKPVVEEAGFYYSPRTQSYHKGTGRKAFRAAESLAMVLPIAG